MARRPGIAQDLQDFAGASLCLAGSRSVRNSIAVDTIAGAQRNDQQDQCLLLIFYEARVAGLLVDFFPGRRCFSLGRWAARPPARVAMPARRLPRALVDIE